MYRLTRSGGQFQRKSLASCLEGLALSLVTAVRLLAGAANINAACGALTSVSVVNTAADVTVDTVYFFLFHRHSLLFAVVLLSYYVPFFSEYQFSLR